MMSSINKVRYLSHASHEEYYGKHNRSSNVYICHHVFHNRSSLSCERSLSCLWQAYCDRAAQRFALHLRREAQRSGVRWKRVLGGPSCFTSAIFPTKC